MFGRGVFLKGKNFHSIVIVVPLGVSKFSRVLKKLTASREGMCGSLNRLIFSVPTRSKYRSLAKRVSKIGGCRRYTAQNSTVMPLIERSQIAGDAHYHYIEMFPLLPSVGFPGPDLMSGKEEWHRQSLG
jgi:hypothetical protein